MTKTQQAKLLQGLRELLGSLDLELTFADQEKLNPKVFLWKNDIDDTYSIRFKPYSWVPKRPLDRSR